MFWQGLRLPCALIGLALPLYLPKLLPVAGLYSLGLLACFVCLWSNLRLVAFCVFGFVFSSLQLVSLINKQLPTEFEGVDLPISVNIASLPEVKGRSTRFEADIIGANNGDALENFRWREHVRLSWYNAPNLRVGETWQVTVRLKRPRGFVNDGGFDYQAWLLSQKIFATGYVRSSDENNKLIDTDFFVHKPVFESMRETLNNSLFENPSLSQARFMRALLIGDKSGISSLEWEVLQATGTLHLMAISGLHIGLIAGLGFLFGRGLTRVLVALSGSRAVFFLLGPLCSLVLAFVYAGFAGFSVPTQRAFLFVLFVNLAWIFARAINLFHALFLCAVLIVVYDPFVFLSPGFYLSFCAVALLFWCFLGRNSSEPGRMARVNGFVRAQGVLFVGLFIPLSLFGLPISFVGLVTNTFSIPIVGMLVVPLLFAAALIAGISANFANLLLLIADKILFGLWEILEFFSRLDFASNTFTIIYPLIIVAIFFLVIILLLPRKLALYFLSAPLLLLIFSYGKEKSELELTVIDVGQGLAVYLAWPDGNLLYDTGARFSDDFDMGSRVIAPWLQRKGVNSLDYLVVSHGDNDHAGGMQGIRSSLQVNAMWLGPSVDRKFVNEIVNDCDNHLFLQQGELDIEVLWPLKNALNIEDFMDGNNSSCVLLVKYLGLKILLTGDIEKEVEQYLLEEGTLPSQIDLLIAPHHGSKSSSTAAFVKKLEPKAVVFSVGYRNRYHHPHPRIEKRYERMGAQVFRTDRDGAIQFRFTSAGDLQSVRARIDKPRAWFW